MMPSARERTPLGGGDSKIPTAVTTLHKGSQVRIRRFRIRKSISGSGLGYFWAISGSGIGQCWPFSASGIGLSGPDGRGFVSNETDGRPFWAMWACPVRDLPGSWSIPNGMVHLPRWRARLGGLFSSDPWAWLTYESRKIVHIDTSVPNLKARNMKQNTKSIKWKSRSKFILNR